MLETEPQADDRNATYSERRKEVKRTQPRKKKYSRSTPKPTGKGAKEDRKQWRAARFQ